jgi:SnoaL-like protein
MGDNMEMAAKFEEVLRTGDFGRMTELVQEYATDDFVQEWPQSGERLTKDASMRLNETYAERSGTSPTFTYKRMIGGGDVFVVEGTIDYGDGVPVSYVGVGEARDGKIAKMTEYFANPFEAPAWRADFVERMEPTTA